MLEFSYSIHICSVHNIFCSKKHSKTVVMLSFNSFFFTSTDKLEGKTKSLPRFVPNFQIASMMSLVLIKKHAEKLLNSFFFVASFGD